MIKLGDGFKRVNSFKQRFQSPPQVTELEHLTVIGDVHFGANVTLKGTVIIVAVDGCRIDIPSGAYLEDKVITGSLNVTELNRDIITIYLNKNHFICILHCCYIRQFATKPRLYLSIQVKKSFFYFFN